MMSEIFNVKVYGVEETIMVEDDLFYQYVYLYEVFKINNGRFQTIELIDKRC